MSWLFSQALVAEYSEDMDLDGAPCALLNGTPTQLPSWCNDKTIKRCQLSRCGTTFKPLTVDNGEAVLMSFLEDFPVRTSVVPGREQASTGSDHPCGCTWQESLVKFDLNSSSWKTHQCLWEEDLPWSSVTLPKWGMMRNGVLWERITPGLPTSGIESGFWPTPRAQDSKHGSATEWELNTDYAGTKDSLRVQVVKRLWPTPAARDYKGHNSVETMKKKLAEGKRAQQGQLPNAVAMTGETGGQLNPTWVEWLMGWPIGWTDLDALETDRFRMWLRSLGKF